MKLYTIILEFQGGTYVAQVNAANETATVMDWAVNMDNRQIKEIGNNIKQRIIARLQDEDVDSPVLLNRLRNIWFTSLLVRNKMFSISIIDTAIYPN